MIVCKTCAREMTCIKTGLGVRYNEDHVYPGDCYACPTCDAVVIKTENHSHYDPEHRINTIDMTE